MILIRIIDIFLSIVLLFIALPIIVITTALIYLDDGSPIFFIQKRVGKNLKLFSIIKFRSMKKLNSSIVKQVSQNLSIEEFKKIRETISTKNSNDTRITNIGRIIRKTSIDEIPQLINVLKNEMSLVGPRPDTPFQIIDYNEKQWIERHKIKPGITGMAQINGRSDITLEERINLDLHYVNNISVSLYFKILLATFLHIVKAKGTN